MKKLLSVLFSFALVMCAFTDVKAQNTGVGALPLEKTVQLNGTVAPSEEFVFEMVPVTVEEGVTADYLDVKTGIDLGDNKTVKVVYSAADTEMVKTASFDLTGLTFEKVAAIYRYKVKEVAGSSDALTYDTAEFIVDLYVNNEGNVANIVARNAESEKAEIKFKNIYTTYGLEVSKTVAGAYGDKNKDFNFVLNVEASSTLIDDTVLKASKTLKDGSKEVVDITVGKDNSFTLKDGESLVVNDLPDGTKYTVSETDANKSGYNTVVNDSDNGVMDKDATVEFTNTKEAIVSTGVMLDSAPYILAFSMGVAVMILLVAKRKRNEA